MNNTPDLLLAARDMIADKEHWLRGHRFNDDHTRHCAVGAVNCASEHNDNKASLYLEGLPLQQEAINFLHKVATDQGFLTITMLNDDSDHNTVMRMFDDAICMAKDAE